MLNQTLKRVGMVCCLAGGALLASAGSPPARTELKRADLSPAAAMEVISSMVEVNPGEELAMHSHHGIESGYIVQGTLIQRPGKAPEMLATGTPFMFARDVVHGGYKVVGKEPLRVFTVHVVDKGKPLYEFPR